MTARLQKLNDQHLAIISLVFLGLSQKEIARRLEVDVSVVRRTTGSDLGQEILLSMRKQSLMRDTIDIKEEMREMLTENLDVPRNALRGFVEQPVFDEGGELVGKVKRRIDPALQINTFHKLVELTQDIKPANQTIVVNMERLSTIKQRAKACGALVEDAEITSSSEES